MQQEVHLRNVRTGNENVLLNRIERGLKTFNCGCEDPAVQIGGKEIDIILRS